MALSSFSPEIVNNSHLGNYKVIDSGGFGRIYKARHLVWCCDVAIKVLRYDDGNGSSLLREVKMMRQGSSPYVIQVLGVFQGQLHSSSSPTTLGLVMEFMERGSLDSLQRALQKPPPWPLLFRLAHQVALGINFLHSRTPAMLHLDLKPSNVLLDCSLNAKLTDFGLAKVYNSVPRSARRDAENEAGTISYMPPEAFGTSYSPTRATDIYSYGILLWSTATGKPPYNEGVMSAIVRLRIPKGDRPSLDDIDCHEGLAELEELKNLMMRCWVTSPDQRPSSRDCSNETEKLYEKHKHAIAESVHEVLTKLKEKEASEQKERIHLTQSSGPRSARTGSTYNNVPTGPSPVQEMAGGWPGYRLRGEDSPPSQPQRTFPRQQRSLTNSAIKASSVQPVHSSAASDLSKKVPPGSPQKNHGLSAQFQRQLSSPNTSHGRSSSPRVTMHFCNVRGFQQGNNNTMHIVAVDPVERRRHRTAPSTINRPPPQ